MKKVLVLAVVAIIGVAAAQAAVPYRFDTIVTAPGMAIKPVSTANTALTIDVNGVNKLSIAGTGAVTAASVQATALSATNLAVAGTFANTPATQTGITASSTIVNTAGFLVVTATGAISLTATPTISTITAVSGQRMVIMGTSDTNTITFSDEGTMPGSLMELSGTTHTLGEGEMLVLRFYAGKWYQEN